MLREDGQIVSIKISNTKNKANEILSIKGEAR